MTRHDEANMLLAKADTKAAAVSQAIGVMLAIGAARPGFDQTVLTLWSAAFGFALLALMPILFGKFGIIQWARGQEDRPGTDPVRAISRMALFKYGCAGISISLLLGSALPLVF